jgi:xanthine dehydrogenase iron-sulfur cluster and FAD-binding subunit A
VDDVRELMSGNICRCGAYPQIVGHAVSEVALEREAMTPFTHGTALPVDQALTPGRVLACLTQGRGGSRAAPTSST